MNIDKIFSFDNDLMSHMPYVGASVSGDIFPVCCIRIDGIWKVHAFVDGTWKRIDTGLSDGSFECSPHSWYDMENEVWNISFIGGASGFDDPSLRLYEIRGFGTDHEELHFVAPADVGYVSKNIAIFGGRKGPVYKYSDSIRINETHINGIDFLYRVTNNANAPYQMLVSGSMDEAHGGGLFTWLVDPMERKLFSVEANGEAAYKACLFEDFCLYAKKSGPEFEDRHIVCTKDFELRELSFDKNISVA